MGGWAVSLCVLRAECPVMPTTPSLNTARLKAARLSLGLMQSDISGALGVARGLAGDWERGTREPSLVHFVELVKFLGCSADWLLGTELPAARATQVQDSRRSREVVLADYSSAPGLRALAEDAALVRALLVRGDEWQALHRLDAASLTKAGYLAVLCLLRGGG